jgi:hypothetical protein
MENLELKKIEIRKEFKENSFLCPKNQYRNLILNKIHCKHSEIGQ